MSGRWLSPITVRSEVVAALPSDEQRKVRSLVEHLRRIKSGLRQEPGDANKRAYSAVHWALVTLGYIDPHVEPDVFGVWVGGGEGHWLDTEYHYGCSVAKVGEPAAPRWEGSFGEAEALKQKLGLESSFAHRFTVAPLRVSAIPQDRT